jgi:osmotically-inducible protein OsmY
MYLKTLKPNLMKSDIEIQKNVMDELKWQPILTSNEIGVSVKNGVATLNGTVDCYSKKVAAEDAAKRVFGVKAIAEEIEVNISGSEKKNDSEIAAAVVDALKWQSAIQESRFRVKVEKGWVTLEGDVEWEFQREAAQKSVESLNCVWGISNLTRVIPKLSSKDIFQNISEAFKRSATIDSERVKVATEGSTVVLTGVVRSLIEKKDAERTAWLAPGVSSVENKLEVKPYLAV